MRLAGRAVDRVVQNMDVNDLVQRIHWDDLLDHIDIDRLLDRIDWNRVMDRIDIERLVARVPVDEMVERSNLGAIVAQSTTGVCTHVQDLCRAQGMVADQYVEGLLWCRCCQRRKYNASNFFKSLPPRLGETKRETEEISLKGASDLAVALLGRPAGAVSRGVAYWIDTCIITLSFAIFAALVRVFIYSQVVDEAMIETHENADKTLWVGLIYIGFQMIYYTISLALVGRTIGKSIVGLAVVKANGRAINPCQAMVRSFLMSLPILFAYLASLMLLRRDRRGFHDLVCHTTVVYAWDAYGFKLRERSLTSAEREMSPFRENFDNFGGSEEA